MKDYKKELLLAQILSGRIKCIVGNNVFYIAQVTPIQHYKACEVYTETLQQVRFDNILTDEKMCQTLIDNGLWTIEQQQKLDSGAEIVEQLKVQLYQAYRKFRSKHVKLIRKQLDKTRLELNQLYTKRHVYDMFTCEGLAGMAKVEQLVYSGAKNVPENPMLLDDGNILQKVVMQFLNASVPESAIRDIARTEPWRSMWNASKAEGSLFGVPAIMMTNDQKSLVGWSRIYDSVYESLDCPSEVVIKDDDLLDGWLTSQHRKRDAERKKREGNQHAKNANGAQEVFVPVDTMEDARRVEALNSARAKMLKAQRSKILEEKGIVPEQYMPDSQLKIRAKAMKEARAAARKK